MGFTPRATLLVIAALALSSGLLAASEATTPAVAPAGGEEPLRCRRVLINPPPGTPDPEHCDEAWCNATCSSRYRRRGGCELGLGCVCIVCSLQSPSPRPAISAGAALTS
ncbi:hypothetical protein ACP70R_026290 [Stipagrostis hirtigluma subsp. patula]